MSNYNEFVNLAIKKHQHYVSKIDWKEERIKISFDNGTNINLTMDEWFNILEDANRIITTNLELCATDGI